MLGYYVQAGMLQITRQNGNALKGQSLTEHNINTKIHINKPNIHNV
jgi:hypothetical protein